MNMRLTENDVVASSSVGAKVSLGGLREARVPVRMHVCRYEKNGHTNNAHILIAIHR